MLSFNKNYNSLNILFLSFFFLNKTNYKTNLNFYYFLKIKLFFKNNNKINASVYDSSKNFNFFINEVYDDSRSSLKFEKQKKQNQFVFISSIELKNLKKKFYLKLVNFFFVNSFFEGNNLFNTTGFYRFFFFKSTKHSPFVLNLNKILLRWTEFFNLIINLCFFQTHFLTFSSPFLKKETLAINWNTSDYFCKTSWKYIYSYFIFKTNKISEKTNFFFKKLNKYSRSIALISDINYHYQNVYYLKRNNFFTIGLIPLSLNPWLVNYPVFASSYSYLNQIFFLQMIVFNHRKSLFFSFLFFKKIWNFLKRLNNV